MARSGGAVNERVSRPPRAMSGFTLIELMITVLIVAILAAVAYPAYTEQIRKAKRAEGKAALLRAAQLQERAYTSSTSNVSAYSSDLAPLFGLGAGATVRSGEVPTEGNYELTVAGIPAGDFTQAILLTATPRSGTFDDPICGVLTLDSSGNRTFSNPNNKGTKDVCW